MGEKPTAADASQPNEAEVNATGYRRRKATAMMRGLGTTGRFRSGDYWTFPARAQREPTPASKGRGPSDHILLEPALGGPDTTSRVRPHARLTLHTFRWTGSWHTSSRSSIADVLEDVAQDIKIEMNGWERDDIDSKDPIEAELITIGVMSAALAHETAEARFKWSRDNASVVAYRRMAGGRPPNAIRERLQATDGWELVESSTLDASSLGAKPRLHGWRIVYGRSVASDGPSPRGESDLITISLMELG